jgi:hypothetical protein
MKTNRRETMNNEIEVVKTKAKRQPVVKQPDSPEQMIMTAMKQGASIEIMEGMFDLREKMLKEQAGRAFREAMSNFQAECPVIPKKKKVLNKDGKSVRYKYAPLDDIVKIAQPFIGANGLSFDIETSFTTEENFKSVTATVTVSHLLGHNKKSVFTVPVDAEAYMNEPQKWASAQTFAKRYAFCNAFGILTGDADDDGNLLGDPKAEKEMEKENMAKLEALPDKTKDGLRAMGYTTIKAAWTFCNSYDFDTKRIDEALEKAATK